MVCAHIHANPNWSVKIAVLKTHHEISCINIFKFHETLYSFLSFFNIMTWRKFKLTFQAHTWIYQLCEIDWDSTRIHRLHSEFNQKTTWVREWAVTFTLWMFTQVLWRAVRSSLQSCTIKFSYKTVWASDESWFWHCNLNHAKTYEIHEFAKMRVT